MKDAAAHAGALGHQPRPEPRRRRASTRARWPRRWRARCSACRRSPSACVTRRPSTSTHAAQFARRWCKARAWRAELPPRLLLNVNIPADAEPLRLRGHAARPAQLRQRRHREGATRAAASTTGSAAPATSTRRRRAPTARRCTSTGASSVTPVTSTSPRRGSGLRGWRSTAVGARPTGSSPLAGLSGRLRCPRPVPARSRRGWRCSRWRLRAPRCAPAEVPLPAEARRARAGDGAPQGREGSDAVPHRPGLRPVGGGPDGGQRPRPTRASSRWARS